MTYSPPPPQYAPPPAPPPKKGGSGCVWWLLGGCLVLIVGCVVLAGGGFILYQSGIITQANLLKLVGLAPASVEVDNFRDDAVHVTILQLDVPQNSNGDGSPAVFEQQLNAFDIGTTSIPSKGRYEVSFGSGTGGSDLGSCTLNLGSGDSYQFVTLADKIVVNHVSQPAKTGPDFIVATSSLCR